MSLLPAPKVLDCTLRDGSYVIDFQFTSADTESIGGALDQAGFPYIEVGHGVGMGASETGNNVAAASDADYMAAAAKSVTSGKWGMFCIPGVANLDHVRLAADHGIGFIRVGTDVAQADSAIPFIELARKLGIEVFANFMKSYVLEPEAFGALAARSYDYGAEMVYLVDSAGGMLPHEVRAYLQAAKSAAPELPLGFHGHDNLGLAVANSLVSLEEGAAMVDTSLQGFGRSSGNTATELFLGATIRSGYEAFAEPIEVMDLGETLVRPLIERRGFCSLDIAAGQALFHSSYMPKILRVAKQNRVDPRRLIIELCKHDKVNAPDELLSRLAAELSENHNPPHVFVTEAYYGEEQ
ncbi:4-hydroxy-2-ketovalerate aldolase [Roseobacter sp. SK209-2-6]|uniref:4-hydroxy-2-oxovalerate aldolase n=1 Tax=Roseobacter sp. SK209-2-6 TaxID=388739 RepID=UPI0000F3F4B9|nr:4-hydroxy-2-oxovalerate aldolase [Roseobacter sp. SK209-2-6]EBA14540.1 4-hydroxy-2-ketovalerate aldolase [Roseobacter sp. SK209-2-6]